MEVIETVFSEGGSGWRVSCIQGFLRAGWRSPPQICVDLLGEDGHWYNLKPGDCRLAIPYEAFQALVNNKKLIHAEFRRYQELLDLDLDTTSG